jgi:hypothetical protein
LPTDWCGIRQWLFAFHVKNHVESGGNQQQAGKDDPQTAPIAAAACSLLLF